MPVSNVASRRPISGDRVPIEREIAHARGLARTASELDVGVGEAFQNAPRDVNPVEGCCLRGSLVGDPMPWPGQKKTPASDPSAVANARVFCSKACRSR